MASAPGPLVDGCLHLGLGGQASAMPGAAVQLRARGSREHLRGQPDMAVRANSQQRQCHEGDGSAAA